MSDSENSKGKIHWKRNFSHKNVRKSSSNSHSRSMNSNSNSPKRRKSKSISNSRSRSKSSSNNEQMLRNVSTYLLIKLLNIYSSRLKPI